VIRVPADEAYAANCVAVNGSLLLPAGYPGTRSLLASLGFDIVEVEMSEFRKMDGGPSCLSVRW
jgi:dimethylargininase